LFITCSESESPEIISSYEANKEKWENASILDYNFVFQVSCYCTEEYTTPKTVSVRDGNIVTVNHLAFNEEMHWGIFSINDLFKEIEKASNQNVAVLETTYDSFYGFPTTLYIDRDKRIADEEMGYSISNFKPL
tara:strand:+ start:2586 stop:2987 length:402 start_codon:yes stop_codon:yes gene_type:complete